MSLLWLLDAEGNLIGNTDAIACECYHFFRMIGEHANVFEDEIDQDLRADAAFVLDEALACRRAIELAARVNMNLRENTGFGCSFDAKATSSVVQVKKNAAIFFRNC